MRQNKKEDEFKQSKISKAIDSFGAYIHCALKPCWRGGSALMLDKEG